MAHSDKDIIRNIQEGKEKQALEFLYRQVLPKVKGYILKNNGSEEDVKDVFQESVITFYEQVIHNKVDRVGNVSTYLFGICRNLWINKAKRESRTQGLDESHERTDYENALSQLVLSEKRQLIKEAMKSLGDRCYEIISLVIYEKKKMQEIVVDMGFTDVDAAKSQHYRCKKKLAEILSKNEELEKNLRFED